MRKNSRQWQHRVLQIINTNKTEQLSTSAGSSGEPILSTLTLEMKPGYNQLFSRYETDLNVAFVQLINF